MSQSVGVGQPLFIPSPCEGLAVQNSGVIVRVARGTSARAPSLRFLQGWGFSDSALLFPVQRNLNTRPMVYSLAARVVLHRQYGAERALRRRHADTPSEPRPMGTSPLSF